MIALLAATVLAAAALGGATQAASSAFTSYSTKAGQFFDWSNFASLDGKPPARSYSADYGWLYKVFGASEHSPVLGYNDLDQTFDGDTTSHTFPYPPATATVGGVLSHMCIRITVVYSARDTWTTVLVCPRVSVP